MNTRIIIDKFYGEILAIIDELHGKVFAKIDKLPFAAVIGGIFDGFHIEVGIVRHDFHLERGVVRHHFNLAIERRFFVSAILRSRRTEQQTKRESKQQFFHNN